MNNFDKGWWNCFNSFCMVILDTISKSDTYNLDNVLEGAGVTPDEIKKVLQTNDICDATRDYLNQYLEIV